MFTACTYKGKPAIFDKVARVYYFGFKTAAQAQSRARELNDFCKKG